MKKTYFYFLLAITLMSWLVQIYILVNAIKTQAVLGLLPVIAYNSPQGAFGWSLCIALLLTIITIVARVFTKK
ncbi:hypothetical protein [Fructilactobacillus carniphilus]|uniref:Uncharacterized protein n=1 Tax=Fructilactobacillus carniphilus TaxID=2940297 RepID=A0ABY5BVM9_9LACO|nr:hypothetical protein [Fructilactobacillus carniphilus]USS90544.1 hypothetical protein M3M37_06830 [Fructilactobacillus carniphilus]